MTAQRLSKLERWILETIRERGSDGQIGRYMHRRELLRSLTVARSSEVNNKEARNWKTAEANASLTRSIKNLHAKGLVRIFAAYRARSYFRTDFGRAQQLDALQAKQSKAIKRLNAAKGALADTSEEDAVIADYEQKRRIAREGGVIPREITGAPDDFDIMDLQFSRTPRVQIVALTEACDPCNKKLKE